MGRLVVLHLILLAGVVCSLTEEEMLDYVGGTEELDEELPTIGSTEGPDNLELLGEVLEMKDGLYDMTRNLGRAVTMRCSITGPAPLNLYIYYDRIATYKKNAKRKICGETIYDEAKPNEMAVEYVIEETNAKNAGLYKCVGESGNGEVVTSSGELVLLDPCEGITCGFQEQCVNIRGSGICTCDFECEEPNEDEAICVDGITYGSLCYLSRAECRKGASIEGQIEGGQCQGHEEATEASCSLSGEGHVTMFDGNFFTFRGNCPYKMAEDTRGGVLVVYARTEACGDNLASNCLSSVTIYVDRVYGFSIERGWLINDNGKARSIMNGETLQLGGGMVSISRVGKTMVGKIENKNIDFFYDGLNYFKITVPFSYVDSENDFGGFCGSIPVDHAPSGGRDISFLGTVNMHSMADVEICEAELGKEECDNVDQYEDSVRSAFEEDPGLAECASVISMESYINDAIQDTCACDLLQDLNYCFCNVAYAYKEDCRQAGVDVDIDTNVCSQSYHQQAFKAQGLNYKRYYRRWYNRKNI